MNPNLPPDGFADEPINSGPPDGFADEPQIQPNQQSNGMLDIIGNAIKQTPLGMVSSGAEAFSHGIGTLLDKTGIPISQNIQNGAKRIFDVSRALGVGTAQNMASNFNGQSPQQTTNQAIEAFQPGYEPKGIINKSGALVGENAPVIAAGILSPGIGGPLAMMAQQAQSGKVSPLPLIGPIAKATGDFISGPGIKKAATGMARRAIGYPKSMLGSTFARGQAADAARVALENDVIPWNGNAETILSRAGDLSNKAGSKLGQTRASVGPQSIEPVFNELRALRSRLTQGGAQGGEWDAVHSKINEAEQTLKGLYESNANQPIYESIPQEAVNAKPASILALPAPKKSIFKSGPTRINPVENVESDLYMKQFEPGKMPKPSDMKRFRNLGWEKVETTDGSTVYADPSYLASIEPDFKMVGTPTNAPRNQTATDFPRGNADYYGVETDQPLPPSPPQPKRIDRLDLNSVEAAKKRIGDGVNYTSTLNSQQDTKGLTHAIEAGIEKILRDNGVDMNAYKAQKRIYAGAKSIFSAANKEVAGQEGNKIGRLSMFGTISDLVSRRLPGTIAKTLHKAPSVAEEISSPIKAAYSAPAADRILTEGKAREYFEKAGRNKKLARELAKADGWIIP